MPEIAASMECGRCRRTFSMDEFFDHDCPAASSCTPEPNRIEPNDLGTDSTACKFGDPTCPCQEGDVCHYVGDPKSETLAMACWSPDCENSPMIEPSAIILARQTLASVFANTAR